ncbi:PREDICTED: protein atonal homolog 8 [Mandrillus leucophaeus]|uniref:protein atonal homolog 8 n=1 Tax=Mandrillus leucophaeus TaxID=9568 RepID=UPI0005F4B2D4|nr:PREDICTED: protein atonal homolog 8 [Mandrillus leucophaeus]
MKHIPVLEDGPWKTVCVKELNGLKKLKRKGKEPARRANGYKTFRLDLEAPEPRAVATNGLRDRTHRLQPVPVPVPVPAPVAPAVPGISVTFSPIWGKLAQGSGSPTRPGESSYSSISHVIYNNHPDSSASPRKRPGEATAASSEIKALQQTRRLLANARERTRVHTISAAFEALRKQVPCYSYGQKLSKLAILRIACNYILSLARLADLDYSADHSNLSFSECVQRCTRTLQAEGRAKKRKSLIITQDTTARAAGLEAAGKTVQKVLCERGSSLMNNRTGRRKSWRLEFLFLRRRGFLLTFYLWFLFFSHFLLMLFLPLLTSVVTFFPPLRARRPPH